MYSKIKQEISGNRKKCFRSQACNNVLSGREGGGGTATFIIFHFRVFKNYHVSETKRFNTWIITVDRIR